MKAIRSKFPIGAFTELQIGVVIHPSLAALRREFVSLEQEDGGSVLAFCRYLPEIQDGTIATLHFCPEYLGITTIAHEALHAVLVLGRYLRLNLEHYGAEELLAESMEAIVSGVLKIKRAASRKRVE